MVKLFGLLIMIIGMAILYFSINLENKKNTTQNSKKNKTKSYSLINILSKILIISGVIIIYLI